MKSDHEQNETTPLLESKQLSDLSYKSDRKRDEADEYDKDIQTRQPQKQEEYLTDLQTMTHFLKCCIGIGILSLPQAVMNAGILVGPLLMFFMAIATTHCMYLLIKCSERLCIELGRPFLNYGEVADECVKRLYPGFSSLGSIIVNILLCITQFGASTAYVLFIAENLHDSMAQLDAVHMKKKLYIPIILPFLLVFCLLKDLRSLSWLSWFANFLMIVVLVSVFQYLYGHLQDPSELDLVADWGDLPLFFGSATYAFEAIAMTLPLENKAKNKNHFPTIMNVSMAIVSILYLNMAIFGYMTFQDKCEGSVTLNLPKTNYYSTVKILVSVSIFFTYFIQIYVVFEIIEPLILKRVPGKYHTLGYVLIRTGTIGVSCGLAAAIPHLNDIISLVGASGSAFLSFVCPTICHWIVFYKDIGRLAIIKNVLIITFGVVGSITGTYSSLRNIINGE